MSSRFCCISGSLRGAGALYRHFYRKSSIGNEENNHAERECGIFGKFQAPNEVGLGKLCCA